MQRREFLAKSGVLAGQIVAGYVIASPLLIREAQAQGLPVASLSAELTAADGLILLPQNPKFKQYQNAFNLRTVLTPQVRVLAKTPQGVSTAVRWARVNGIELAFRAGGHSYEGFSQSKSLVIDVRLMNTVVFDPSTQTVQVGAGAALGDVYRALAKFGVVIPAGSCPTVGATGHTLGGGFGLLARPYGLACDNVIELDLVDADGNFVKANDQANTDLFWACRGGGGGSFGVVTGLKFRTHPLAEATVFGFSWDVSAANAVTLFQAWQDWAPHAPGHITGLLRISRDLTPGVFHLRCFGQSTEDAAAVRQELAGLINLHAVSAETIQTLPFLQAFEHFAGSTTYPSEFMKGKSDYVKTPMSAQGMETLLNAIGALPAGVIDVICDAYGAAVADVAPEATAFPHRAGTLYCMQYSTSWSSAGSTPARLKMIGDVYQAMRPYVSGESYLNYCDLDLGANYAKAYWGGNLERLMRIKKVVDPENFFRHPQSVPVS